MKALLITLVGWFPLNMSAQAQNETAPNASVSQTTKGIVGVWAFVGNMDQAASTDKKIKIILDKHYTGCFPSPIPQLI